MLVLLLAVVIGFQWSSGAFKAEFSGYPDEASHYISGLLVHDYIRAGAPESPLTFAEMFYLHYPYLAIGHWPPVFYGLEGLWMSAFSSSRISILLLMALITALLAFTTFVVLDSEFGTPTALLISVLLVTVPVVQKYASMVMMDTLVALLSLWAVMTFSTFLSSGGWRDSTMFAVVACIAILTKGNALFLALVPGIALLLTRRFELLKRAAFWSPVFVVGTICMPWHLVTMPLMIPTFNSQPGTDFVMRTVTFYGSLALKSLSPAWIALAAVGVFSRVVKPLWSDRVEPIWAALTALLASLAMFYCTVPAGIEERYFISAVPPLLMFAGAGTVALAQLRIFQRFRWKSRISAILGSAVVLYYGSSFSIQRKLNYGFNDLSAAIVDREGPGAATVLVSTDTSTGEGILVSELAIRSDRPRLFVLRASKVLADSDWNANGYRPRFNTSEALRSCLDQLPTDYVVFDSTPGSRRFVHHEQLFHIVRDHQDDWELLGIFRGKSSNTTDAGVYLYRRRNLNGKRRNIDPAKMFKTNFGGGIRTWPIVVELACSTSTERSAQ